MKGNIIWLLIMLSAHKISANAIEDVLHARAETSCSLESNMELEACDFSAVMGNSNTSLTGKNQVEMPEGTMCMVNPGSGDITVLICDRGVWINSDTLGIHENSIMHHPRHKRFWGLILKAVIFVGNLLCSFFCPRGGSNNSPPPNNRPTITCPAVADVFYADKGKVTAPVSWQQPTASDPEDGTNVQISQTQGQVSGSEHPEGRHTVSFLAKDSQQAIATCSFSFSVIVRRCPMTRTSLLYGIASCQPAESKHIYGSICTYTCNSGYLLKGSLQAECMQDGTWSNETSCGAIACGPPQAAVANGRIECGTQDYSYQSRCVVSCDAGYDIESNDIITCQADKTWTEPGQCVDKEPPRVLCGSNIEVFAGPKRTPAAAQWPDPVIQDNSGGNVTLACDRVSGSVFELGQTKVTCTGTDEAKNTASCSFFVFVKEKLCPRLEPPENSDIFCSHQNTYGSECTVTCHQAYELVGEKTQICQNNQTWSGEEQLCSGRKCTAPPPVSHGGYDCVNGTTYQTSCPLVCDDGYRPIAPLTITCDINIQWTQRGSCLDVTPPNFPEGCPADKDVTAASFGEPTYVIYELPRATDNSNESIIAVGDPPSGFAFGLGITTVTVRASDSQGNVASCQFDILVRNVTCSEPRIDRTGKNLIDYDCSNGYVFGASCALSCSDGNPLTGPSTVRCTRSKNSTSYLWSWAGTVTPYCDPISCKKLNAPQNGALACDAPGNGPEICVVLCNANYTYPSTTPLLYTCFTSSGTWNPSSHVPNCTGRRRPGSVSSVPDFYYYSGECSKNITAIQEQFLQAIGNSQFKDLCTGGTLCQVDRVDVFCGPTTGRRKKRSAYSSEYKISPVIDLGLYKDTGDPAQSMMYYEDLTAKIYAQLSEESNSGLFTITTIGQFDGIYGGQTKFNCQPGTMIVLVTMSCAGCGEGHMYDNKTSSCVPCPRGTYQDQEISFSCTPCPAGTTSQDVASTSVQQCLDLCLPGQFSETGIKPCDLCPEGSFQPKFGGTGCNPCPWGMSTLETGGISSIDCQFFNFRMSENSTGPIIQLFRTKPRAFTITLRIHVVSSSLRTAFTFALGLKSKQNGTAFISLNETALIISPAEDYTSRRIRREHHVVIVYLAGNITLYVDGIMEAAVSGVSFTDLYKQTFTFTPSEELTSVALSHFEMTDSALSADKWSSCNKRLDKNILVVDVVDTSLITPSVCDDIDDCVGNPCGEYGTCVDEVGNFSCLCDEPWSGDTCQVAPEFCLNHKCKNGGKCVNQPEYKNYSCACAEGYAGALCERLVVNGSWGEWGPWTVCSVTCGLGQMSRSRNCDNPKPDPQGQDCVGIGEETEACNLSPCPVDCRWGQWSVWTCSSTCGVGWAVQTRQHEQEAQNGGLPCHGPSKNYKDCELSACTVDGNVGEWAEWSACSVSCGGGVSIRQRYCDNPPPSNGGRACRSSDLFESRTCNAEACPECKSPDVREGTVFNCTTDVNRELTICQIDCPEGQSIFPAQTNIFQCGRLTNYTWTQETDDNPTGLLPTCSDMKPPNAVRPTFTITYDVNCIQPLPSTDIKTEVINKLSETECKERGKCDYSVQTSTTCKSRKRSTQTLAVVIVMTIRDFANNDTYMRYKTDEESAEMIHKLNSTEAMIQEFIQKASQASNVTVGGVTYTGKAESPQIWLACQDGSGFYNGFCVDCPAGTYSAGNGSCVYCDPGHYQDQVRSSSCIQCPEGKSTKGKGSYSLNHCTAF